VLEGTPLGELAFESAVLGAQLHPKESHTCIVSAMMEPPLLCNLKDGTRTPLPLREEAPPDGEKASPPGQVAVAFTKNGEHCFAGDDRGCLHLIHIGKRELVEAISVGKTSIKGLHMSRNGKHLLVNSTDRKIRLFDVNVEPGGLKKALLTFEDSVNRNQWKCLNFSGDSDFVCAGSSTTVAHNISIWHRDSGHLEKILEGPKEGILDVAWHPVRPIIASVSTLGVVYIWSKNYTENWSAFAPDFTELEENEEYFEKEDEFDLHEWETKEVLKLDGDAVVDVIHVDKAVHESDDDDDELFFLPTVPNKDEAGTTDGSAGRIDHPGAVQRHNEALFGGARQQEDGGESDAKRAKVGGDGAA